MKRFSKSARILKRDDFAKVRRGGTKARSGLLALSCLASGAKRLGIVTPKNAGTAVERNRIKRIVREFFRTQKEAFPRGDCVVVAYEGAGTMTNAEIRAALATCTEKLKKKMSPNNA